MIFKIYSVYDQKAHAFLPPFILPEEGLAVRTFADCVNKEDHQFCLHPEDYTLHCLGTFDDNMGAIAPNDPRLVGSGIQYVETELADSLPDLNDLSNPGGTN